MVRLISPMGSIVNVTEEKAARLGSGWAPFEPEEQPVKRKPGRPKKAETPEVVDEATDSDES